MVENIVPGHVRKSVYWKYEGHCAYCGSKISFSEMEIDHRIPKSTISFGRVDYESFENRMPSCEECNHLKTFYDLDVFRFKLKWGQINVEKFIGFDGIFYFEKFVPVERSKFSVYNKVIDNGEFGAKREECKF